MSHFYSPLSTTLTVPNTAKGAGEIFRTAPGHPLGNMENRRCRAVIPLSRGVTATPKKTASLEAVRSAQEGPQHWYNISIRSSEANISLTLNTRENLLGCEIYINDNKALFNFLKAQRGTIEQELGAELEWIDARKASRAVQRRKQADIDNEAGIADVFDWLIDRAMAFEKVFVPLLKKFKDEQALVPG